MDNEARFLFEYSEKIYIVIYGTFAIMCFIGIWNYIAMIRKIFVHPDLKKPTYIYMIHVAIADICFLAGIQFLVLMTKVYEIAELCTGFLTTIGVSQYTISILLFIINVTKCIETCYPSLYSRIRKPVVSIVISNLTWFISISLVMVIYAHARFDQQGDSLIFKNVRSDNYFMIGETIYFIYASILSSALPIILISILLCVMILILRKSEIKKETEKETKLITIITITYFIRCLPNWVFMFIFINYQLTIFTIQMFIFVTIMITLTGYINGISYPTLFVALSNDNNAPPNTNNEEKVSRLYINHLLNIQCRDRIAAILANSKYRPNIESNVLNEDKEVQHKDQLIVNTNITVPNINKHHEQDEKKSPVTNEEKETVKNNID